MIGFKAHFERADAHARSDGFDHAAERAGVLRNFVPMSGRVRLRPHIDCFQFSPCAEIDGRMRPEARQ